MENNPMEDNMKHRHNNRMVTVLALPAIFVIVAIMLTQCVHVGEDQYPEKDANTKVTTPAANVNVPNFGSKDAQIARSTQDTSSGSHEHDTQYNESPWGWDRYGDPVVPTFQTTGDGYIWYNNEEFNYALKFPEWMSKEIGSDGNIILTGSAPDTSSDGKTGTNGNEFITIDSFTINARFVELPEGADSMSWFEKLENQGDQKVTYNGTTFKLEAVADTEGPYMRRTYTPLAERGALELTFTYSTTSDTLNTSFEKKATEGFYTVINSATELFMSN